MFLFRHNLWSLRFHAAFWWHQKPRIDLGFDDLDQTQTGSSLRQNWWHGEITNISFQPEILWTSNTQKTVNGPTGITRTERKQHRDIGIDIGTGQFQVLSFVITLLQHEAMMASCDQIGQGKAWQDERQSTTSPQVGRTSSPSVVTNHSQLHEWRTWEINPVVSHVW